MFRLIILFIALLIPFFVFEQKKEEVASCEQAEPELFFDVDLDDNGVEYIGLSGMKAKAKNGNEFGGMELGLYSSEMRIGVSDDISKKSFAGDSCHMLEKVKITVSYKHTTYMLDKLNGSSCANAEVLRHEFEHKRFELETLDEIEELAPTLFSEKLEEYLQDKNQLSMDEIDALTSEFIQDLEAEYKNRAGELHQSIDNKESYEAVFNYCPEEFGNIMSEIKTDRES